MNNSSLINENYIRNAIAQLVPQLGQVFEIRVIRNSGKKNLSGYFKDADTLIEAFKTVDLRDSNVYITLQQVNESCYSRLQSGKFVANPKTTTADNNIDGYNWLFIDLDPDRTSDTSSTVEELNAAFAKAKQIVSYMSDLGFYDPVKAVSGNGAHLLYRIRLKNDDVSKELIHNCLTVLNDLFSDDVVKVDISNFNPSRICKLYGTMAQKGADTEERPHRMSHLISEVFSAEINDRVYLEKLAGQLPTETVKPAAYNSFNPNDFDVETFMNAHGIGYKEQKYRDGVKYVLDVCPFDENHKAPDSAVFKLGNGALGFKCLHNSCADKSWQDFRKLFEPNAYEREEDDFDKRFAEGIKLHNRQRDDIRYKAIETEEHSDEPMFLDMRTVRRMPDQYNEYIKTGIDEIDNRMQGLAKKAISVVTGCRGAAKSTFLSQVMLNAVESGCNIVVYSGELSPQNFFRWISLQAAGKKNVVSYGPMKASWRVKDDKALDSIADWMSDRLWLYNNNYGNNFRKISTKIRSVVAEKQADLVIIDNLMALDITDDGRDDKYEAQTRFVQELKDIAITCNVHVVFVAHPRKALGFLRLDDISGSGNIANVVDTAFVMHRVNEDFKRLSKQMFKWSDDNKLYEADNCIEVCKDRENGIQDLFIPLWFEGRSKRLMNTKDEYKVYGWEKLYKADGDSEGPY